MIDPHQCFRFEDVKAQADKVTATWNVPEDLPYLQGHFPGSPIVPAVGILDATTELLSQALQSPQTLKQVKNAKFTTPLTPNKRVQFDCVRVNDDWSIDLKIDTETIAKLLILT